MRHVRTRGVMGNGVDAGSRDNLAGLVSCTIVASEGHTYRRPLKQGSTNPRSSAGDPHQREQLSSALCLAPRFRTPEDQLAADHGLRIFADKGTAGFGRAQRSRKPGKGIRQRNNVIFVPL
jgi:hypothetical protein